MSTLNGLKLVNAKRTNKLPPVVQRRNKLVRAIWEQMELCKARQSGGIYAPVRLRTVKNVETGERTTLQVPKRVRAWHWTNEDGKTCVAIHYGSKVLELKKGLTAIELASDAELLDTLSAVKQAVEAGELDAQIEAVSGAVKKAFRK